MSPSNIAISPENDSALNDLNNFDEEGRTYVNVEDPAAM